MRRDLREYFDSTLEHVIRDLPERARDMLQGIPMYVEDYPSRAIMRKLRIRHRRDLCGLYTGIPLTKRSVEQSGYLSEAIYLFREGILQHALRGDGSIDDRVLAREIRVTVLHELGHHHGLDEDELRSLGYG
jgi:predicted Zn-dependent protease with MMP-like domain